MSTKDAEKEDNQSLRSLITEWNNVGHVPFKEKDKLYAEYQNLINKLFKAVNQKGQKSRMHNFVSNINKISNGDKGQNALYKEREKLMRAYDNINNELKTYQNNMGFLSVTSKGANS